MYPNDKYFDDLEKCVAGISKDIRTFKKIVVELTGLVENLNKRIEKLEWGLYSQPASSDTEEN